MKLARSQNALRNMRMGMISKIANAAFPFLVRAVFIRTLGAEYMGVNSLYSSVLSVLSLAELGFGSAVVFSMYQAIADDDDKTINALLYFYRKVYRIVGLIILGIGLLLIPVLPYLTKGSYPSDINPIVVYLIFLINTVLSYFLFAYLGSLMSAFQRNDVSSKISMIMNIMMNSIQIVLLLTVQNYYAFLAIMPVFTVLSNICTAVIVKQVFPQYKAFGKLAPDVSATIWQKVRGLMIQRVCVVSRNAFDSLFISIYLGLTQNAIYNNYYYVMTAIMGVMAIATSAAVAGAGNSVAMETQHKNHQDMLRMNFVYMWISGWCTICLLCLFQQFMVYWQGSAYLLSMTSVALLCMYFYVLKMGDIRYLYDEATGMWWHNRYRALAEAGLNILLNWQLGKHYGVNGIIVATLISLFFVNFCYGSQLIYKYYFTERSVGEYYRFHVICAGVTFAVCLITYLACRFLPMTLPFFFVRGIICVLLPNILYFAIYRRTSMYREAVPWMLERVGIQKSSRLYRALV